MQYNLIALFLLLSPGLNVSEKKFKGPSVVEGNEMVLKGRRLIAHDEVPGREKSLQGASSEEVVIKAFW